MNKLIEGLFVGLIFLTLFFANPAFAYSTNVYFEENGITPTSPLINQDQTNPNLLNRENNLENNSNEINEGTNNQTEQSKGFTCGEITLSDKEVRSIMDLTKENFQGKEITDGSDAKADGTDLEGLELVGSANNGESAIKQEPPSKASSANRFSFFDKRAIDGPFGVGVILDDTLRVGRCKEIGQENCRVYGNGLEYRTGGEAGFKEVFVNASSSFKDFALKGATNLTDEEYQKMQNQVYDKNDFNVKVVQGIPGDAIPNGIVTDQFIARNATSCNNNSCMVSTYSSFDRHFNSWFSSEMVVSAFGPTLINSAARRLGLIRFGPDAGGQGNKVIRWVNDKSESFRRAYQEIPSKVLGQSRGNMYKTKAIENGLGEIFNELTVKKRAFSTGAKGFIDEMLASGSKIDQLTPKQKKAFFSALQDLKAYSRTSAAGLDNAKSVYNASAKNVDDLVDYGRYVGNQLIAWDDDVVLDFVQWVQKNPDITGLKNYAFKRVGYGEADGFIDITTSETFNFKKTLLTPFGKNGSWDSFRGVTDNSSYAAELSSTLGPRSGKQGIQLYKLKPNNIVKSNASVTDLEMFMGKIGDGIYSVDVPGFGQMPLNANSLQLIKDSPTVTGGAVNIYSSSYAPDRALFPEDLANILTHDRIRGRPTSAGVNLNELDQALRQRPDFAQRSSLSTLDALVANEKQILKDYYTLKANTAGFYKAALGPIGFYQMKRGLGNEKYSAYMLPDTWTSMLITTGQDDIYKDAFIDFYANEGADQGDLFSKVMNSFIFFPNYVVKEAADSFSPQIGEKLRYITGEGGLAGKSIMRNETQDIAFYSHNEDCSGCNLSINQKDSYLSFTLNAPVNVKGFIVEALDAQTAQEKGTALIAYGHHINMKGKTGEIEGEEINISTARSEGITCEQKLKETAVGFAIGNTGAASGLFLAGSESLAYAINPGFGMLMTGAQQILITPKLQDCVDDKEGYYMHFFSPPSEQQAKSKSKEALSNETVTSALSDMSAQVNKLTSDNSNPVEKVVGDIKEEFDEFANKAKSANLLQATIEMLPPSNGSFMGEEIFYIWFKNNTMPNGLKTEGTSVIKDGNTEVLEDYSNGDLSINGKKVVDNKKEILGLSTQDNRVPAKILPKRVNTVTAPNNNKTVFELNTLGELTVKEAQVLECVRDAIKAQSGIEYSGTELTQVFGNLKSINTENYGSVFVRDRKIHLEGNEKRVYGELGAKFIIDGKWNSRLEQDANKIVFAGKFIGMAFEHGSIVINEETNELVVWLRQHKESVLSTKEVSGLNAKLSSTTDPESECGQPAIELDAKGYPNDELGQRRVENFNTSMDHLGPFTQFTTDGKLYEFYAKRDESGECKDYFRVVDKETGKVLTDAEIVGGVRQDGDGKIKFNTTDGKSHELEFDADNGVPKLRYNNGAAETLRTAQGTNGSFWFDPNTGQWYPENGTQIPLSQAFKDQGSYYGADKEGNVTGTPGNPMTFNIGSQGEGGFNVPSLPQTTSGLFIFILAFALIAFFATQKIQKKK